MRIVIGAFNWIRNAGVESYTVTLAEQLVRLGHEVTIHPQERGPLVDDSRARGLTVTGSVADLPTPIDAIISQDDVSALELAAHYPGVPQLYVVHAVIFDMSNVPRVTDLVGAAVVLNDSTRAHAEAAAAGVEPIRLRQPIDLERFAPNAPAREPARRVLSLGHYLRGEPQRVLEEACRQAGLELRVIGGTAGNAVGDPVSEILDADIVVGCGRCVIEAMACGRAAFVYDWKALGGWVTPDSYPDFEATGFTGLDTAARGIPRVTAETLAAGLCRYDARMGRANLALAQTHHRAHAHARAIVELLVRLGAPRTLPPDTLREMAWLARRSWLNEARAYAAGVDALHAREETELLRSERDALAAERDALAAERETLRAELAVAGDHLAAAARLKASRRHQLAESLAAPLDRARRR